MYSQQHHRHRDQHCLRFKNQLKLRGQAGGDLIDTHRTDRKCITHDLYNSLVVSSLPANPRTHTDGINPHKSIINILPAMNDGTVLLCRSLKGAWCSVCNICELSGLTENGRGLKIFTMYYAH